MAIEQLFSPILPVLPDYQTEMRTFEEQALYAFSAIDQDQPYLLCDEDILACKIASELFARKTTQTSNHHFSNSIIIENDYEMTNLEGFHDKPGRIFKCPTKKCYKAYKNRTGLKYHLLKGQCKLQNGAVIAQKLTNDGGVGQDSVKPFYCKICYKYYKNLNCL
jgi:hypothetical protein